MRIRLLKEKTIENFVKEHANSATHFENWKNRIEFADWSTPKDITNSCLGNLIGGNRVVFDLGENGRNAYRMICEFMFGSKFLHLYINWIGTHEEYNALKNDDKLTISDY